MLTTVGMLTDIVRAVAPAELKVVGMLGSGVDPHLHKPSVADVKRIRSAAGILYSGLHLEGRLQPLFEELKGRGRQVEAVSARLPRHLLLVDESGQADPHVWMDPTLWSLAAQEAAEVLAAWFPEHAEEIAVRTRMLRAALADLDAEIAAMVETIPEGQRVLISAHDAFGYFGRRYGIEVHGIQGLSTDSEAGLRRLNELVERVVAHRLPAVFVESTLADKNVRALVEGAASRGHRVVVGGELYSDAMGTEGTEEGTYFGMLRHNARTITRALGGRVAEISTHE